MTPLQRVATAFLLLAGGAVESGLAGMGGKGALSPPPAGCEDFRPPAATALSLVALDDLTNRFGVVSVEHDSGTGTWHTPDAGLRFFDRSRRLVFNGTLLWMNGATVLNSPTNTVVQDETANALATVPSRMITQADVDTVLVPLLNPADRTDRTDQTDQTDQTDRSDHFIVILDPGHGGDDPGAVVAGIPHEKTLVLDVARRVRRRLNALGIKVRMTRSGDKTLALAERPEFAGRKHGSVLVSIHANKAPSLSASGIETFVMPAAGFPSTAETRPVAESYPGNRHDAASLQLGYFLQRELIDQTQAVDRGVKRARFEVLRLAPCPAALIEIGFLSNTAERKRLSSPAYRDRLADGIAHGIRVYMLQNTRPAL